jgi:HK97 family phage prohead protease
MLHKTFRFEVVEEPEGGADGGWIEGLASVYGNLDEAMEIVDAGAFTRTLKNRNHKVPLLWQHRTDTPIGLANLKDSPKGLTMKAELNSDVRQAQEARSLAKQGVLGGLSIGYDVVKDTWDKDVRHLKEVKLYEVSMVTFPANLEAQIVAVKEDVGPTEEKPYPNEHTCRLHDPGDFEDGSIRTMKRDSDGKEYRVLVGKLKGESTMTEQAYRYPKDIWSAAEARKHCSSHDGITFEPATGESSSCLTSEFEVKIGRTLSASTRSKLESARQAIEELLTTADADADSEKSTPPPDMAPENSPVVADGDPELHSLVKMMREMREEVNKSKGVKNV